MEEMSVKFILGLIFAAGIVDVRLGIAHMKKLMIMVSLLTPMMVFSYSTEKVDGITWAYTVSGGEDRIGTDVSYGPPAISSETSGEIRIPSTLGGMPVTSIGCDAFYNCKNLTSVTIPPSVISIESSAFYGCSGLTSMVIPSGVKSIGAFAFEYCRGIESLTISEGVMVIDGYAFSGCSGLKSVTVPSTVVGIAGSTFSGCSGLESIAITEGVGYIGGSAFKDCSSLTAVTIPSSVTIIGSGAFCGCSMLASVTISKGVTSIGDEAFSGCKFESVVIPSSVVSVGCGAFYKCKRLTSVTISNGVQSIGESAFEGCDKLMSVVIPSSVTSIARFTFSECIGLASMIISEGVAGIADDAFNCCTGLKTVTIPSSVTRVGALAFYGCSGLTEFSVATSNLNFSSRNGLLCSKDGSELIRGVNGDVVVPDGVTSIGDYAFHRCYSLTSVSIAESVTKIGDYAFLGCSSLVSIIMSTGVKSIGVRAFEDCRRIDSVHINDLAAWCEIVFRDTSSSPLFYSARLYLNGREVTHAVIPDSVTNIGIGAFYGCDGLVTVEIPSSVKGIGGSAFANCSNLTLISIPSSVKSIGNGAFKGCGALADVTISEGVISVGANAFCDCSALSEIVIPKSVTEIGDGAFCGCSRLTTMTLPFVGGSRGNAGTRDSVFGYIFGTVSYSGATATKQYYTNTASSNFYIPQSLQTVEITDETIIAYGAFYGCSWLTSIQIPPSVASVRDKAFWGCSGLKTVVASDLAAWCQIEFETADANPVNIVHSLMMNGNEVDDLEVPSVVKRVGSYAFAGASSLTSVTMHPSVKNVGDGAFEGCTSLTSVRISDLSAWCCIGFDSLNANPLALAHKLLLNGEEVVELVIPEGVPGIGSYSFAECSALTSVTIPTSVKNIGEKAFYNCSSLMRVLLPWDVNIGADAIPASTLIVRPVTVAVKGCEDEYVYDGLGKCYGVELEPSTNQYSVLNVTNTLSVLSANVGVNQIALSAEMFQNTNENYEVTFVVDSISNTCEVVILPRSVTVSTGSAQKVYDGTPLESSDVTVGGDGFVEGECVARAVRSQTSVGSSKNVVCLEWAKGESESNYSIVTNEGTLTVLPAKMADAGAEPGAGTKPVGGISKFDGEAVKYDGEGHTINVAALEAVALVADTPVFSYSLTSNGVYRSEPYYFTNACVTSFWYKISAANYEDYVHEARVTILPREVTLTSGSASKNFDGTALRCERVEVTGDGFVEGEGVDVVYTGSQLWPGASENTFTYSFKQGTLESNYEVTTANGTLTVGAVGRVVVDAGVTAIPAEAFKNYTEMMEVVLPDTVTEIGADAFAGCAKLTKVAFPSGMEVTREKLREWGLSDAVLDDYVEGDFIIVNTSLLGYVGAADVAELVIPNRIEQIDEYALSELYDLERVELPETVKNIGKGAFANDTYLDEVVLPDSVEVIGEGAFADCSWMRTMTMGAGVRLVGDRAFAGCTKLATAKFADGLGEVGDAAFSNCWRMMSVSLPVSVSNVAATAFKDCASLTGVTVPTMIAPMSEWFAPVYRQIENVTVPKGTTEVCAEMFAGCAALKTVELPEGVTNIASGAFRDCVALETILLPESLEAIGDEAFAGCAALKAIVLPKNVAVLGKRVFSGCAALSDVTLSRALTAIPDGTFAGCDALDSFVVPESVAELGSQIVPSATTAIYYLGNAPAYAADVYAQANASLVSYVVEGTKGWDGRPTSRDLPRDWPTSNARTIRMWSPPPPSITVRFNATGGTVEPEERVYVSEAPFGELPVPVRTHYDFAGWFTEASGGTQVTAASEVPMADRELFAHWTERVEPPVEPPVEPVIEPVVTNTITYINLLGATNTNVTEFTTNDLPLALGPVEREGWRFLGWMPNGGVIPVGTVTNMSFAATWEKIVEPPPVEPPVEPPEEPEVNPWCEDADFSATAANTYDGYLIDEDYNLLGVVQVKTTKQTVKKTTDRVTKAVTVTTNITATATVTDANGKKWSYSKGEVTVEGVVAGLKCTTKGCPVAEFGVKVGMNGMDGAWGEYAIFGARNGMGTKGDAMMAALEAYKGKWSVSLSTSGEGAASPQVVRLQLDVQAKGVVKVAGNWESGAKVSASAQLVMGDGFAYVPVMVKSTKTSPVLNALLRIDAGDAVVLLSGGELVAGGRTIAAIEIVGYLAENPVKAGAAYVGRVALNELAYPAKFTQKGLPTGLKIDAATGVVSGTPTKPGEYEVTFTATSSMNSKSNDVVKVTIKVENYVDGLIPVEDYYGPYTPGVSYTVTISAADGCTVSGMPTGMKWTAKDVKAKDGTVTTPANSIYGIPTKPGKYTVYFKKSVSELNEKNKSVKVTHTATATFEVADYPTITLLPSLAVAGSEPMAVTEGAALSFFVGVRQSFAINLAGTLDGVDTTVSAKGLPSGLKLVKKTVYVDPSAKKKVVGHYEYVIEGVPTKASSLDKQKNVVPSHVTLTASNKYKWSGAFAFDITVVALPTWAYGTFDGGNTNGMAQLTVSNVGKLSGKWMSEGLTWTLSAASFDTYDAEREAYCAMVIGKSGKLVMTNEIEVTESEIVGFLTSGEGAASPLWGAWRNGWKEEPLKTLATKLKGQKVQVGEVQLTVGSSGAVTAKRTFVTGYDEKKQKDITYSVSCSTVLIPTAEAGRYRVYLYFPPKAGKFEGFADIVEIGFSDS